MTATDGKPRTWPIARQLSSNQVPGLVLIWGVFVVVVAALAVGIELVATIGTSVWEQASQLTKWFALGMGVYLTAVYLPLFIAHGYTRREFSRQAPLFGLVFAAVLAVLTTVGFALEAVAYRAAGWTQDLAWPHLFDSPTQFHLVAAEYLLVFAVFTAVGALVAAGFYRRTGLGVAMIPVGLLLIGAGEAAAGAGNLGPVGLLGLEIAEGRSLPAALVLGLGVLGVVLALAWTLVRRMPVRTRRA